VRRRDDHEHERDGGKRTRDRDPAATVGDDFSRRQRPADRTDARRGDEQRVPGCAGVEQVGFVYTLPQEKGRS
jgi:hypothetical protein